jgi:uncharacterized protein (TIGR02246 family)
VDPHLPSDEQIIRDLARDWAEAAEQNDLQLMLSLMTGDVVFLSAGNAPVRGRDAFAAGWAQVVEKFAIKVDAEIREIKIDGDVATQWSHLTVTMTPRAGGKSSVSAGEVLTILRKQDDGRWLVWGDANLLAAR